MSERPNAFGWKRPTGVVSRKRSGHGKNPFGRGRPDDIAPGGTYEALELVTRDLGRRHRERLDGYPMGRPFLFEPRARRTEIFRALDLPKDEKAIAEMWQKARAYVIRHYSGYDVDLAPLIPARSKISTTSDGAFALGGEVNIGIRLAENKASVYSTVLHEMKHAIDQNSHRALEGAALEGAATTVERQICRL